MGIADHIRDNILLPRLRTAECLVVYDPELRYQDLCLSLATDTIYVIDASQNIVESREQAMQTFQALATHTVNGLLIYTPTKAPITDEDKQKDPFSIYGECGDRFPNPNNDQDEYLNLCITAKPEHNAEIRQIFATTSTPAFAVIDAIGGGLRHPQLRATLNVESSTDLLIALLAPTADQLSALKHSADWLPDAKDFLKTTIGHTLKTRSKDPAKIADELWRFILFSEFAFDLPTTLPDSLKDVPKAPRTAEILISNLCDRLRNDQRFKASYIEKAEAIEAELNLSTTCTAIDDLGIRDTFPFEERTFLTRAIRALTTDHPDHTRDLLTRHENSIWRNRGENQEQWSLLQAALNLICACGDCDRELSLHKRTLTRLIDYYINSLRLVDQRQREFEESVGKITDSELIEPAIAAASTECTQF